MPNAPEPTGTVTKVGTDTPGRVLVIDDEEVVRRVLGRLLELEGYDVETAETVATALKIVAADPPDLVLADVRMPDVSGIELCERLPEVCGWDLPIILLSGLGARDDILAGFDAGARDYILKPWREEELLAKVRLHCRPRPTPQRKGARLPFPSVGEGRFRLERQIGVGGMGAVFSGHDRRLGRPVAVKVLRPDLSNEENFALRFLHEARILGRLELPGVPQVHDAGREGDCYYYVMDLLDGRTLRQAVEADGPVAPAELTRIGHGVAHILERLEAEGVMHRDIKPDNIMMTAAGDVSLVDFGLARTADEARFTSPNAVVGTAGYLPPELLLTDDEPNIRGDLYALGMTLWFAATGKDPAPMGTGNAALLDLARASAADLGAVRTDLPVAVVELVKSLTAPEPTHRPRSARRARIEFARIIDGRQVTRMRSA